jgi:integrase
MRQVHLLRADAFDRIGILPVTSIQAGYPPKMLQEIMGHASITTTLDLYGHLYPGDMDRYADRLDNAAADAGRAKIRPDGDQDTEGTT